MMAVANQVWNRVCFGKWTKPRPGDAALGALLRFHDAVMNGGIDHAVDCLSGDEIAQAARGYRYFGFVRVATMVSEAPDMFRDLDENAYEARLSSAQGIYSDEIPSDSTLVSRFQRHFDANPGQYEPIS